MITRGASNRFWAGALSTTLCVSAFGQAIVLDKGQTTFGLSYQHTFVRYHIGFDGTKSDIGHIMSYAIQPNLSYGLTDRVTFDADIPLDVGKYSGPRAHGRLDDGTFHGTFQDFHLGARVNVLMQPLAVTPFLRVTIPSHDYQLEGHTATGKDLGELTVGTYGGRDLGPMLPNAYIEGMASHSWVQRTRIEVASERLNRTNASLELGYYLTQSVTLSVIGTGVRTHGGWNVPRQFGPGEFAEHDRFVKLKDNQLGATAAYTFRSGLGVYGGYFTTVWARNAHSLAGPTIGLTWSPQPRQAWLARTRTRPAFLLAQQESR